VKITINKVSNAWKYDLGDDFNAESVEEFRTRFISRPMSIQSVNRGTALHLAAIVGNLVIVKALIENGADVNALNWQYATPLIIATTSNHVAVAQELLSQGADPEVRNAYTFTAMYKAVSRGNMEMIQLLESASPFSLQFMDERGRNLLAQEISGDAAVEIFRYLVSKGVDLRHRNRNGYPMLACAMQWEYARQYLIPSCQTSFSVVSKEPISFNPLAKLACRESPFVLKRLVFSFPPTTRQVMIEQEDIDYCTPLCAAASSGNRRAAKLLVSLGADIEHDGSGFGTPVMCAIACGWFEIVKFLVRQGARLEYSDKSGSYRSGLKASLPHPKITRWLLVGRYQDQQRLTNSSYGGNQALRPWSGKRTLKVALLSFQLRTWGDSTLDYCIRLESVRKEYVGKRGTGELV
jgi:ankyrin repeat protein